MFDIMMFLILLIPYGVIWFILFRYIREDIKTALNYSIFILLFLIGFVVYLAMTWFVADHVIKGYMSNIIGSLSYATIMFVYLLIILSFVLTLILAIINFAKKRKGKTNA